MYIGVDEAGRGALAGPVSVGVVMAAEDFDWRVAYALVTKRGEVKLRDSKKLSPEQRDTLYEFIIANTQLKHASALVPASQIDAIGIVPATLEAAAMAIASLGVASGSARVMLDAGLRVPDVWQQESFVRGDESIPVIALASIIAKVSRDRMMTKVGPMYAAYGLEGHKGYGTAAHLAAIREHGFSDIHRRSFCGALQMGE